MNGNLNPSCGGQHTPCIPQKLLLHLPTAAYTTFQDGVRGTTGLGSLFSDLEVLGPACALFLMLPAPYFLPPGTILLLWVPEAEGNEENLALQLIRLTSGCPHHPTNN